MALRCVRWSKSFDGRKVLDDVDLCVRRGEVHALVGHNGSGKSTLIKVLAGYHTPDKGAVLELDGVNIPLPLGVQDARRHGIAFIHQDLGLNPNMTVLENVCAARYDRRSLEPLGWRRQRARVRLILDRVGLQTVDPNSHLSELTAVERTLLAIGRAMDDLEGSSARLLVLDEPTVYLPADGIDRLFTLVRAVAASGTGVLFVSHDLDEVKMISDRVTVLRDGRRVATEMTADLRKEDLTRLILGGDLEHRYPARAEPGGGALLRVAGLSGRTLRSASLEVERGEIVGVTGLLGSGQDELPYLIFGAERAATGTVEIRGKATEACSMSPRKARDLGVALVPANRLVDGSLGEASACDNVTLLTLDRHTRRGRLRSTSLQARATELVEQYDVQPPLPRQEFRAFSGGNQQKLVLAKWLEANPSLLMLHEPTQGVDVGARRQIHQQLADAARRGTGVLIASTEYEDISNVCHRVVVLARGAVVADLRGPDVTHRAILEACYGASAFGTGSASA